MNVLFTTYEDGSLTWVGPERESELLEAYRALLVSVYAPAWILIKYRVEQEIQVLCKDSEHYVPGIVNPFNAVCRAYAAWKQWALVQPGVTSGAIRDESPTTLSRDDISRAARMLGSRDVFMPTPTRCPEKPAPSQPKSEQEPAKRKKEPAVEVATEAPAAVVDLRTYREERRVAVAAGMQRRAQVAPKELYTADCEDDVSEALYPMYDAYKRMFEERVESLPQELFEWSPYRASQQFDMPVDALLDLDADAAYDVAYAILEEGIGMSVGKIGQRTGWDRRLSKRLRARS